jgi:hypothetical protein
MAKLDFLLEVREAMQPSLTTLQAKTKMVSQIYSTKLKLVKQRSNKMKEKLLNQNKKKP